MAQENSPGKGGKKYQSIDYSPHRSENNSLSRDTPEGYRLKHENYPINTMLNYNNYMTN